MANAARLRRKALPYSFVLPLTAILVLVNFYPMLYSLWISLSVWPAEKFLQGPTLAGLVNYDKLFHSDRLWGSVGFMLFYVISTVCLAFLIGTVVALLLATALPARGAIRSLVILPIAMAPLVIALTWRQLFDVDFGVVNYVVASAGLGKPVWLSTLPWARLAIVIVDVWQAMPFVAVALLAGLQAIPDEYAEAARIDGSGRWQIFWRITLPLLRPSILVAAVVLTTNAVRMFDLSYALTGGGPVASTETLACFAWNQAFTAFNLPLAAAVSWVVFALNLIITLTYMRVLYVKVEV